MEEHNHVAKRHKTDGEYTERQPSPNPSILYWTEVFTRRDKIPTPLEIRNQLSEQVIGQQDIEEEMKKSLAVKVYNHYKRTCANEANRSQGTKPGDVVVQLDKSTILIMSSDWSGSIQLVKSLAKAIDAPLAMVNALCLAQPVYFREDVESLLTKLYIASGGNVLRCQRGIIYIEEIDKVQVSRCEPRYFASKGVQTELLKLVGGGTVQIRVDSKTISIDTSNILFICGGAFPRIEDIIRQRVDEGSDDVGSKTPGEWKTRKHYLEMVEPIDLIEYGILPEFIDPFPEIVTKAMTLDELVGLLTVPKNALIQQYKLQFAYDGVELHVTDCGVRAIAETAVRRRSGARGLKSILKGVLHEAMYIVPSFWPGSIHTVYVDSEAVESKNPILLRDKAITVDAYIALQVTAGSSSLVVGAVSVKNAAASLVGAVSVKNAAGLKCATK